MQGKLSKKRIAGLYCPQRHNQAYWDNEVAADQKYKDKLIKVTGSIVTIKDDYLNLESTNFLTPVTVYLNSGQDDKLAELAKDQRVTVQGICKGSGLFGVSIRDAFLTGWQLPWRPVGLCHAS